MCLFVCLTAAEMSRTREIGEVGFSALGMPYAMLFRVKKTPTNVRDVTARA